MGKATTASSAGGIAARASAAARLASGGCLAASLSEVSLEEAPGGGGQVVVARSNTDDKSGSGKKGSGECQILAPCPGSTTRLTSRPAPGDILPGGIVLGVSSSSEGGEQKPTARLDVVLGALQCSRFLCCSRNKIYWTTPEWGTSASDLPPETQFVLAELRQSSGSSKSSSSSSSSSTKKKQQPSSAPKYAVLVPLIDKGAFRATLRPPPQTSDDAASGAAAAGKKSATSSTTKSDKLCLRVESGSPLVKSSTFDSVLLVAAGGGDPLALADAAVVAAAALSGAAMARTTKRVPEFVDLFGWCTWDAFYSSVSARGISDGLSSLRAAGAPPPRFLIIDDGWQVTSLDGPLLQKHHAAASSADAARADAELDALMRAGKTAEMKKDTEGNSSSGGISGLLGPMANAAAAEEVVEREVREAAAEKQQLSFFGGDESVLATNPDLRHKAALAHLAPIDEEAAAEASAAVAASNAAVGGAESKSAALPQRPRSAQQVFPAPRPSRAKELAAAASGWAKGKAEVALASIYGKLVERAPAGSTGIRVFAALVASADPGGWNEKKKKKQESLDDAPTAAATAATTTSSSKKAPPAEPKDGPLRPALLNFYASTSDHVRRLASFRANAKFSHPAAGPAEPMLPGPRDGLALVVADVRERFGVRQVLAWHALHGYWGGVAPEASGFFADDEEDDDHGDDGEGNISKKSNKKKKKHADCLPALVWPVPTPGTLDVDPPYAWSPQCLSGVGLARDPDALFRNLHGYLKRSGIDGVKVDAQATLGMIGGGAVPAPVSEFESTSIDDAPSIDGDDEKNDGSNSPSSPSSSSLAVVGGPSLSALYHAALERSISDHFPGNAAINCMCHSTEDIFNFSGSAVARTSDDFWPRDPASHRAHVAVNAFNSVFFAPLVQPDWDMFHSRHPAARLHAIARVVSGGPVYVSDAPGNHDAELLRKLALPDGRVLRPAVPGRPTEDCLFSDVMRDGQSLLKVSTVNGTVVKDDGGEEEEDAEREERRRRRDNIGVGDDFFRGGGGAGGGGGSANVSENGGGAAAANGSAISENGGEVAPQQRQGRRRNNDVGENEYCCGVVGVFNTQGAAWSRKTRRFELLKTPTSKEKSGGTGDVGDGQGAAAAAAAEAEAGCSPSGITSWLKSKLLPLCGQTAAAGASNGPETDRKQTLTTTVGPADVVPRLRSPPSGCFVAWSDLRQRATLVRAGGGNGGGGRSSSSSFPADDDDDDVDIDVGIGDSKKNAAKPPSRNSAADAVLRDSVAVSLARGGADLVTFSPVLLLLEGKNAATLVRAAVLGLAPFFNAGGALLSVTAARGPARSVAVALRGHGRLVVWCERRPSAALVDGRRIERDDEGLRWDEATGIASVEVAPREIEVEGGAGGGEGGGGGEARAGFEPDAEVVVHW